MLFKIYSNFDKTLYKNVYLVESTVYFSNKMIKLITSLSKYKKLNIKFC